jgi:hypothetical protein
MERKERGKRMRKGKKENEWGMCHRVGGWGKMRLSSPSQSGGDMWQGEVFFLFKPRLSQLTLGPRNIKILYFNN